MRGQDIYAVTTIELAAALIAVFEGERLTAYRDTGGVCTIGFGHTLGVHDGMTITHEQAVTFLRSDIAGLLHMVEDIPVLEAAALVSFGYNVGASALQKVIDGSDTIGNPKHTTDRSGAVRSGLVARRRLEEALCALSQEVSK
jgi:lysozyme